MLGPGQLLHVLPQLVGGLLPGEVRVPLGEADPAQLLLHGPVGEGLGQEDHVGVRGPHAGDQPLPEGQGLGVGVVDPEDPDPPFDPGEHHVAQRGPQAGPVVAVEVEVVDVLVALGRVLGVLEGAVGAMGEPLGVLGEPGVVGGALHGQIEGHVDAQGPGVGHQGLELGHGAQVWVHGVVAARRVADGPRRPGVIGAGRERVVAALALGEADGAHRRQVEHVEAQFGQGRKATADTGEPAPRPGEQLVPGPEPGEGAVDVEGHRGREGGGPAAIGVQVAGGCHVGVQGGRHPVGLAGGDVAHGRRGPGHRLGHQPGGVGAVARSPRRARVEQGRTLGELAAQVGLAGLGLAGQLHPPRRQRIGPGPHVPPPGAGAVHGEGAAPAHTERAGVEGVEVDHGRCRVARSPHEALGPQHLVAVSHHVDRHRHRVTHGALGCVPATVERGLRAGDHDPGRRCGGRCERKLGVGHGSGRGGAGHQSLSRVVAAGSYRQTTSAKHRRRRAAWSMAAPEPDSGRWEVTTT